MIIVAGLFSCMMLKAQSWLPGKPDATSAGSVLLVSEVNYEHLCLDESDDLKSKWGIGLSLGADYYLMDNIYAGASVGYSDAFVRYDYGGYAKAETSIYDVRIPVRAGLSVFDSNIKFETGPFVNFTVGGNTTYTYGGEKTVTKIKDTDVSRAALGWSINLKLFGLLNVGYSFMLTDSPYGEGGDFGFLSIGIII